MIKEFIGTGKTIDEATLSAKTGLNAPLTADVKIEVIQMPKGKILGLFGGCDAQVKASYDDGVKEKKTTKTSKKPPVKKTVDEKKKPVQKKQNTPEKSFSKEEFAANEKITNSDIDLNYVNSYVKTIIDGFNVKDAQITSKVVDGVVEINVECDDYGIIIGRRGETLDALQYLTSLAIKNVTQKYVRVTVNVGNYRAKREETLKALAIKNANYVARTGRRHTFEPMNPYERRIIHTAVQNVEGVISRSVGSGMDRKVLLEPEGGVKRSYNNSRRNSRQNAETNEPRQNREKRVDRADIPKFGKIEINKD